MDEAGMRKRESILALLAFLWGVEFTLLILRLVGLGLWTDSRYGGTAALAQILSGASFVAGAVVGIWILAGRTWRGVPRAWRFDAAFGYLALLPASAMVLFATTYQRWDSELACLWGGGPLLLAYLLVRVVPSLRRRGLDDEDFP